MAAEMPSRDAHSMNTSVRPLRLKSQVSKEFAQKGGALIRESSASLDELRSVFASEL